MASTKRKNYNTINLIDAVYAGQNYARATVLTKNVRRDEAMRSNDDDRADADSAHNDGGKPVDNSDADGADAHR